MKKVIRIENIPEQMIPAQQIECEEYQCEMCGFITEDEETAETHYGKNHTVKERRKICGHELMLFDTKEDCQAWRDTEDELLYDRIEMNWSGPGWYYVKSHNEPCSRGCCTNYIGEITHIQELIGELAHKSISLSNEMHTLIKECGLDLEKCGRGV